MKLAIKGIAVLVIMIFVSVSCNKSDEPNSGQVEPINDDSTEVVFPIVVLDEVIEITNHSAKCKGRCINDGGSQILEKGVCWSTSNNPSVRDCHVLAQGDSLFVCEITNLEANTTYYLRAYASNSKGVSYGNEITFKTEFDHEWLDGVLPGLFSVFDGNQVRFSQGNMYYQSSSNTWKFADNQYDYVGEDNLFVSDTTEKWRDLFDRNIDELDISINGSEQNCNWRYMSTSEWEYLLDTRITFSGMRYAKAKVNGINGVVLFPDDWRDSICVFNGVNQEDTYFNSNKISDSQWYFLEAEGAVFLPAAGRHRDSEYYFDDFGERGAYWSATSHYNAGLYPIYHGTYALEFYNTFFSYSLENYPFHSDCSVRFVLDAR